MFQRVCPYEILEQKHEVTAILGRVTVHGGLEAYKGDISFHLKGQSFP